MSGTNESLLDAAAPQSASGSSGSGGEPPVAATVGSTSGVMSFK